MNGSSYVLSEVIKIKSNHFFTGIIGVMVISLLFLVPAVAAGIESPMGWAVIPVSDPSDDVVRFTDPQNPAEGILGDYHNEIDIESVTMHKGSLCINFNETPLLTPDYGYTIYIDSNGDNISDAVIIWPYNGLLVLFNETSQCFWNSTSESWSGTPSNLSYAFNTGQLALKNIDKPVPNIASANIGIAAVYGGDPTYCYGDFAPLVPTAPSGGGIPSFSLLLTLFSLLTLLGLVFLQHKPKI